MPKKNSDMLSIVSPSSSCSSVSMFDDGVILIKKSLCPICGGISHNKHFGICTCNACAAFFRRTIAHQRRYTCVRGKQCHISYGNARHLCRFCRFQRCIKEGMNISAVFVRSTDEYRTFEPDSPLRTILLSQRATFVNRYTSQLKSYGGDHSHVRLGTENPNFNNTLVTISSESFVLKGYLMASGFKELGLSSDKFNELAHRMFYSWICFHSIMSILRNAGHKTRVAYFIDESHIKVSDEAIMNYIQTWNGLKDYKMATEATKRFFNTALELAEQIHLSRMEEVEHATMYHIYGLQIAAKLYPENPQFSETINELFSHLKIHYEKNFDDTALKMGNMILMLSALEKATTLFTDYVLNLYLNGYNTILTKMMYEKSE